MPETETGLESLQHDATESFEEYSSLTRKYYQPFRLLAQTTLWTYAAATTLSFLTIFITRTTIHHLLIAPALELIAYPFQQLTKDNDHHWSTTEFFTGLKNIGFLWIAIESNYTSAWTDKETAWLLGSHTRLLSALSVFRLNNTNPLSRLNSYPHHSYKRAY